MAYVYNELDKFESDFWPGEACPEYLYVYARQAWNEKDDFMVVSAMLHEVTFRSDHVWRHSIPTTGG
jgi:hypothetical protein